MTAETTLLQIAIRVGRTGALNPWAVLEPVEVGGVTVSRATLHNEEDINRKEIRAGDRVIVQRAGDVIPQVVGPAGPHAPGTQPFAMPTHCPLCGFAVVKPEGEAMHRCPNRACPSRGLETLINWVGAAADIDGVGEQFVRRLWAEGLLRSMPDLYKLTAEQLMALDGYGEISARNAIAAIDAARRTMPFRRVLFGLNIPDVGWVTAQNLARHFGDVDRLAAASPEELVECEGIGPERAEAISDWFADEDNRALIEELRRPPIELQFAADEEDRPVEGRLSGRSYVVTGTLGELHARGGQGGARGAFGAQGVGQRLEEDDRRRRGRESGCLEARQGRGGRGAPPRRGRLRRAARGRLARNRREPRRRGLSGGSQPGEGEFKSASPPADLLIRMAVSPSRSLRSPGTRARRSHRSSRPRGGDACSSSAPTTPASTSRSAS